MTGPLLSIRRGSRVYGPSRVGSARVTALDEIDIDIRRGEFVAIVGPSGGGKSTLLSVLGLLDELTSGEYRIDGALTSGLSDRRRTRLRSRTMAFVFQAFHLLERRQVIDSAELALLYQGVARTERRRRAADALAAVGLAAKGEAESADLSGGQRQRVAIARAMATANPVILADEPTGNLDTTAGEAVLDQLDALHRRGATVVVVTHSESLARRADRVIRIEDGRIVDNPSPADAGGNRGAAVHEAAGIGSVRLDGRGLRIGDLLADALRSVLSRRLQTLALLATVAIAVGMMVVTLGVASSARAQVSGSFDARANREVSVTTQSNEMSLADAVRRASDLAGADDVAALSDHGDVSVTSPGEALSVSLHGVAGDLASATRSTIRWLGGGVRELRDNQVLLGASLAAQLRLPPIELSPEVLIDGRPCVVVGTIEVSDRYPLLAGEVVASETTANHFGPPNQTDVAIVTAAGAAAQVGEYAPLALDPRHPDDYLVHVPVDPQSLRQDVEAGVQTALTAFTVLMALVAAFAVSSTLTMSVVSRRSELGLRRAIGGRARDVGMLVAAEASFVGIVGGAVGLVLGVLCILGFTIAQRWLPVFDVWLIPLSLVAGLVLAAVSSLVPAVRAARVAPAVALRS
ncbi:MAG: hypothetical protein BGN97_16800 [Microbacterium sp. 69-10]|uniref:ABC transporter ATP-binding protein/permease n=1 Tax=Microbacterium sp. 69-10 TaxID=1895783 RepID=UPI00096130CC|nr:ATP-binding cassette domain-containing protein [Microbacterium sp. 69-10]OJU40843.1 MAG: hypothetical protein BGN97_16800 [Microbacterium sp. 69-10]